VRRINSKMVKSEIGVQTGRKKTVVPDADVALG
jgi:hypothetical protein